MSVFVFSLQSLEEPESPVGLEPISEIDTLPTLAGESLVHVPCTH